MKPGALAAAARRDALRAEIAGFQTLIRVLHAEADALRRADADALHALSAAKLELVSSLQGLARQRANELRAAGLPETANGAQTWLALGDDADGARDDWQRLTRLALEAKRQNEVNGRLAARQRWHFDAALGALIQAAGVGTVYGADGRTRRTDGPGAHVAV
jgi:flagellar biosynthesis/type III secretory pathway chaperone